MSTQSQERLVALRGATTCSDDTPEQVIEATSELLTEMFERNLVDPADLVSIVFTATPDLTSSFPAEAARALGIADVPLLCAQEMAVPGAVARCIRVLAHLYSTRDRSVLQHVYLRGAEGLRRDLQP